MLIAYNVDVPMERLPLANWVLIAVTCAVSIWVLAVWDPLADLRHQDMVMFQDDPIPAKGKQKVGAKAQPKVQQVTFRLLLPPLSLQRDEFALHQLLTYQLVHGDLMHLAGNMFFLFVFGNAVNAKLGHVAFLASYFTAGAVAGLAWLLIDPGMCLVGASGAIMGMAGMFLVFFPRNDVYVFYFNLAGGGSFTLIAFWFVLIYMALDLLGSIFSRGDGVAYVCHLGGQVFGIALAIGLIKQGFAVPSEGEENLLQTFGFDEPVKRRSRKRSRG